MFLVVVTLVCVLLALLYKWSTAKYETFSRRGVPHEKPTPLLGNISVKELCGKVPHLRRQLEQHQQYRNVKVYGMYFLRDPVFVVRDLELIKNVGVKDFDHFMNHVGSQSVETLLSKSLVSLKDREWKEMRAILSPTFTGSKMRAMYELINACSELAVAHVKQLASQAADGQGVELEMRDFFTRFTNDVIASAAFGIKVNSFEEKNNKFFQIGQVITNIKVSAVVKALLHMFMPRLMKALRVKVMDEKSINYFRDLVFDAIKFRVEHNIIRPDMIHLLMEAQRKADGQEDGKRFSDDDLLAQCLLFFFAGFDTVSTCLCFVTYELCMNPDVQQRLYEEILDVKQQLQDKPLDYDTLTHMKYMDMVISEALRMWPPASRTDRGCNADIDLRDEDDNVVVSLRKGDRLFIPIMGLHYDPENFDEPEKFRPERFSEENKANIKPFTYLPFGVGPRNCIGNRMALMEVKSVIYHLLTKFKLVPADKTVKDMMSNILGFRMVPKDKFWLKYVPREPQVKTS